MSDETLPPVDADEVLIDADEQHEAELKAAEQRHIDEQRIAVQESNDQFEMDMEEARDDLLAKSFSTITLPVEDLTVIDQNILGMMSTVSPDDMLAMLRDETTKPAKQFVLHTTSARTHALLEFDHLKSMLLEMRPDNYDTLTEEQQVEADRAAFSAMQARLSRRSKEDDPAATPMASTVVLTAPQKGARKVLSGAEAANSLRRFMTPTLRIPMVSSGFWVDLTPATLMMFSDLVAQFRAAEGDLGRELGIPFYLYQGAMFRRDIWEQILSKTINHASLTNWQMNRSKTICDHLLVTDFDALVWGAACAYHRDGFDQFAFTCPHCGHHELLNIDLRDLLLIDWTKVPKDARTWFTSTRMSMATQSMENITAYRKQLYPDAKTIVFKRYRFTLQIPTMTQFFENASSFLQEAVESTMGSEADLLERMTVRRMRQFIPWVREIEIYAHDQWQSDPDTSCHVIQDPALIRDALDLLVTQDDPDEFVADQITNYINASRTMYVARRDVACPSCNKTTGSTSGFVPIDPITAFFTVAVVTQQSRLAAMTR